MDERLGFLRTVSVEDLPEKASFEHRIPNASGPVALHYWPARSKLPPRHLTLFILGNPALLDYYVPFLQHLCKLLPETHAILSTSHIGHSPDLPAPEPPLVVPAQLEAKIELVEALRSGLSSWASETSDVEEPEVALMGHSFGGWLTCEIMKRLPNISAGYLLFPSNGWLSETWNGRTTGMIAAEPFTSLLPRLSYLARPLLPFTGLPLATKSLVRSPTTIRHCLATAKSEFEHIKEPDFDWFRTQRKEDKQKGLFGVWSAGNLDGWVGREGPMIQECLGGEDGGRVRIVPKVPHAFCLRQDHSELVAGIMADWLAPSSTREHHEEVISEAPTGSSVLPM